MVATDAPSNVNSINITSSSEAHENWLFDVHKNIPVVPYFYAYMLTSFEVHVSGVTRESSSSYWKMAVVHSLSGCSALGACRSLCLVKQLTECLLEIEKTKHATRSKRHSICCVYCNTSLL